MLMDLCAGSIATPCGRTKDAAGRNQRPTREIAGDIVERAITYNNPT